MGRKEVSDWSGPSLFEVAAGPSEVQFEQALAVVRQYLAAQGELVSAKENRDMSLPAADARSQAPPRAAGDLGFPPLFAPTAFSVAGNVDATSFTGAGSGLRNINPANLSRIVFVTSILCAGNIAQCADDNGIDRDGQIGLGAADGAGPFDGQSVMWTNTLTVGDPANANEHCDSWQDGTTGLLRGRLGFTERTDALWTDGPPVGCISPRKLACFQQ